MGNLTTLTIFVVCLNVLMWFSSIAMIDANPAGTICYSYTGTIIDNSNIQSSIGGNLSVTEDPSGILPETQNGVISSGGNNIFTDIFNNIVQWMKTTPGLKYLYGVVSAPYNILNCMGLPPQFVAGIGTLWYLVSGLVMVSYIWWRE